MEYLCTCARAHRASVSQERFDRLCSNLVWGLGVTKYVLSTSHGWSGVSLRVRTCTPPPPPSPYLRIRLTNFAKIWCVARDPIVTRLTKIGGGVTEHSHVRFKFRCLDNRSALTFLKLCWNYTKNGLFSFGLARSSPNMASYWLLNWWKQRGIAWVKTSSDGTKIGFLFSFDPFSYHHWEGGSAQHGGPSSWLGGGGSGTPGYKVTPLNLKRNPILVPSLVVSIHAIPNIFKNVPPLPSSFQQSIKY